MSPLLIVADLRNMNNNSNGHTTQGRLTRAMIKMADKVFHSSTSHLPSSLFQVKTKQVLPIGKGVKMTNGGEEAKGEARKDKGMRKKIGLGL